MKTRIPNPGRRATTLIEAVVVVIVLAVAIPPSLSWLAQGADRRADAITVIKATTLASAVLEQVMADSITSDIGADSASYLGAAGTGLQTRLGTLTSAYSGLAWTLSIGSRVNSLLVVTGSTTTDLYRVVGVTIAYTDSGGTPRTLALSTVVFTP